MGSERLKHPIMPLTTCETSRRLDTMRSLMEEDLGHSVSTPAYVPNELLGRLVGFRLFSVQFVLDYVQLRFDGGSSDDMPVLNCDVMPDVERGDEIRDALVGPEIALLQGFGDRSWMCWRPGEESLEDLA